MDYELTTDQRAMLESVDTLLRRHAGRERARALRGAHDDELLAALGRAGFLGLATDADAGPLEAALVVEAAARELAAANVAGSGLVAPMALGEAPRGRVALATANQQGPIRYGADAEIVLVLAGDDVQVVQANPRTAVRVPTGYVAPYGRVPLEDGRTVPGAGPVLARWWRVAIAAELSGLLSAALELTVDYLGQREQFGKPLGGLQALQHRLAECYVWVEGTRWMARTAAWQGDDESAAAAATYATMAAREVAADLHQLSGAIGFTEEYDLHLWTMRALALRVELGGISSHASAVTAHRWAG